VETYYVYPLTNRSRVVLYIGVTNSLERRLWFHGNTERDTFVKRYNLDRLVYYESYRNPSDAIAREKRLKRWRRDKKNTLIETKNPKWNDLGQELFDPASERSLGPESIRGSG
jgi:putative endonuclease